MPESCAPDKFALEKSAFTRIAPFKLALLRFALRRMAPDKLVRTAGIVLVFSGLTITLQEILTFVGMPSESGVNLDG